MRGEVVDVLLAQLQILEQHAGARQRRGRGPGREGGVGGGHGRVHVLRSASATRAQGWPSAGL
jgi:hypothetical protein